jgi:hypothetical protein
VFGHDHIFPFHQHCTSPSFQSNQASDISSMTQFKRVGVPLTTMLDRDDLHPRLGTPHALWSMRRGLCVEVFGDICSVRYGLSASGYEAHHLAQSACKRQIHYRGTYKSHRFVRLESEIAHEHMRRTRRKSWLRYIHAIRTCLTLCVAAAFDLRIAATPSHRSFMGTPDLHPTKARRSSQTRRVQQHACVIRGLIAAAGTRACSVHVRTSARACR